MNPAWTYRARPSRIVDGDTIDVTIDLGFRVVTFQRLRLAGVNTPEIRGAERPAGLDATEFVNEWIARARTAGDDWPLVIKTGKTGKYGRWIARLYNTAGDCLNDDLDSAGHNKTPNYGPGNWT